MQFWEKQKDLIMLPICWFLDSICWQRRGIILYSYWRWISTKWYTSNHIQPVSLFAFFASIIYCLFIIVAVNICGFKENLIVMVGSNLVNIQVELVKVTNHRKIQLKAVCMLLLLTIGFFTIINVPLHIQTFNIVQWVTDYIK